MAANTEKVSVSGPQWAMAIILAALLGTGGVLAATSGAQPSARDNGSLSRIEAKIDSQAAIVSDLRESVAEIRGELKARKSAP